MYNQLYALVALFVVKCFVLQKLLMEPKNECGIGNKNQSRVYHCIAFPSLSLAPN